MKQCIMKSIVLGTIVFMILASASTTSALNKHSDDVEPLADEEVFYVVFPDIHIYYTPSKIRYPKVEFDESGTIIDVNLSGVTSNEVAIRFNFTQHIHTPKQFLTSFISWNIQLGDDGEYGGGGLNGHFALDGDYQETYTLGGLNHQTNYSVIIPVHMYISALPVWLKSLQFFHLVFDVLRLFDIISFPKITGAEATYQLDIHT